MLKNFNKKYRNNRNISIFTSITLRVYTATIFIFQHNQQYDTLLPIVPCTHKLKAGIAYYPNHNRSGNNKYAILPIYFNELVEGTIKWAPIF
jgi:hypothetical protein